MRILNRITAALAAAAFSAGAAAAQTLPDNLPVIGAPHHDGIGFQPAATELASDLHWLDGFILVIITAICIFVMGLLVAIIVRYNRRANPTPATFTHNSPLEVTWTVVPLVILIFIGAFSLPVLFKQQIIPEGDVTIKVTGRQWYWSYEYPQEEIAFDSFMIGSDAGKVLTHRFLLREVWGPGYVEHSHYLRIYMAALRQKLEADSAEPRHLLTETGVGYRFVP